VFIFGSTFFNNVQAQAPADTVQLKKLITYTSELEFQLALTQYVKQQFLEYGLENIPRERYLISLMRLVNNEMRHRIKNPREAREKYFSELQRQLEEIQELERRLDSAGISELNSYVDELKARIKRSI
jgi:hypothetical protein